jgi:hypothetical protein
MSLGHPIPGSGNVGEFMVSAIPWVTSSNVSGLKNHRFDHYLTKWVIINNTNSSGSIKVGFTELGIASSSNYFSLSYNQSFAADLRIKEIWLSGSGDQYTVIAGLTAIPAKQVLDITGSNGYPGVG